MLPIFQSDKLCIQRETETGYFMVNEVTFLRWEGEIHPS